MRGPPACAQQSMPAHHAPPHAPIHDENSNRGLLTRGVVRQQDGDGVQLQQQLAAHVAASKVLRQGGSKETRGISTRHPHKFLHCTMRGSNVVRCSAGTDLEQGQRLLHNVLAAAEDLEVGGYLAADQADQTGSAGR